MSTTSQVIVRGGQLVGSNTQVDFILLDSSGSMVGKWWDSLNAIDAYIAGLRQNHVASHLLLNAFSSQDLQYTWRDGLTADVKTMQQDPPGPHGGGTPLYDAINMMARRLQAHKAMRELKDAIKALEEMSVTVELREHGGEWFLDTKVYTQRIRPEDFMEHS